MAQIKAQLNGLRISPRKVRAVANLIRRKNVNEAMSQLDHVVKNSASHFKKLLISAIANAENNKDMVRDNLFIKELAVDEGMKLKRFRPKGFGRASMIQKKTSRIRITLEEKVPGLKKQKIKVSKVAEKSPHAGHSEVTELMERKEKSGLSEIKKPEIERELGSKGNPFANFGRKLFRRKSI